MFEALIALAVIALVVSLLGFRGVAGLSAGLAKALLVVFLVVLAFLF